MLSTVRIKNLALAEDLTIGFESGFTAITGETGAGKSILIGAIKLALGERADRTLVRNGADQCMVEVVFNFTGHEDQIRTFLAEQGIEAGPDNELFIKRAFNVSGANRQFVNGSPVPLQTLARLGELLVDLHGPHDHQSLLHPAQQRDILDAYAGLSEPRQTFASLGQKIAELEGRKAALTGSDQSLNQQMDLLRFQVREIESAQLLPDEESQIEALHSRAANAARVLEVTAQSLALLAESDQAVLNQLGQITRGLQELTRIDPAASTLLSLVEQGISSLRELQSDWSRYAEKVDLNPEQLRTLEERLDRIKSLKRKYGRTVQEIIAFGLDAAEKLGQIESRGETLARLEQEQAGLVQELWKAGRELTRKRREVIPKLVKATLAELRDLGFKDGAFEARIRTESDPSSAIWTHLSGLDEVEFEFSPNVGEPPRPLRSIASSGEMARVMLALKTVLADQDRVPVLIFDEIDANVGGETAGRVGEKMLKIARRHQVLCITHLPAVAAAAHQHLVVAKKVRDNRTITEVASLEARERVDEIARMLGGKSQAAMDHAQTMLQKR